MLPAWESENDASASQQQLRTLGMLKLHSQEAASLPGGQQAWQAHPAAVAPAKDAAQDPLQRIQRHGAPAGEGSHIPEPAASNVQNRASQTLTVPGRRPVASASENPRGGSSGRNQWQATGQHMPMVRADVQLSCSMPQAAVGRSEGFTAEMPDGSDDVQSHVRSNAKIDSPCTS